MNKRYTKIRHSKNPLMLNVWDEQPKGAGKAVFANADGNNYIDTIADVVGDGSSTSSRGDYSDSSSKSTPWWEIVSSVGDTIVDVFEGVVNPFINSGNSSVSFQQQQQQSSGSKFIIYGVIIIVLIVVALMIFKKK